MDSWRFGRKPYQLGWWKLFPFYCRSILVNAFRRVLSGDFHDLFIRYFVSFAVDCYLNDMHRYCSSFSLLFIIWNALIEATTISQSAGGLVVFGEANFNCRTKRLWWGGIVVVVMGCVHHFFHNQIIRNDNGGLSGQTSLRVSIYQVMRQRIIPSSADTNTKSNPHNRYTSRLSAKVALAIKNA